MGMEYKKIHSCPSDCILYKNEYGNLRRCPKCLPIILRLKCLFINADDAKDLRWHANNRMGYFVIQLILCNGRRLINNFLNLEKNQET